MRNPLKQQGMIVVEGLVAILIFSVGILALVGLQTTAIGYATGAKSRSDASYYADQIIGQMWANNPKANLTSYACNPCTTSNGNADTQAWVSQMQAAGNTALPRVTPSIAIQPVTEGNGQAVTAVTVSLTWQAPSDKQPHTYVTQTNVTTN